MTRQHGRRRAGRSAGQTAERKPRAERWQQILGSAAEIFLEKGYDATSLQDIADRVGILKGSIYYYIKTKSDLRDHLLREVHEAGIEMIGRLALTEGTTLDRLEAMIRGHLGYVCTHLAKTSVYLQELRKRDTGAQRAVVDRHAYRNVFVQVLEHGQARGEIRTDLNMRLTAQILLSSLNSLHEWYRSRVDQPDAVVNDHFVATLLAGVAADRHTAPLQRLDPAGGVAEHKGRSRTRMYD